VGVGVAQDGVTTVTVFDGALGMPLQFTTVILNTAVVSHGNAIVYCCPSVTSIDTHRELMN
jgi:hypothetical protein